MSTQEEPEDYEPEDYEPEEESSNIPQFLFLTKVL